MKKIFYLLPCFAMALASCSNDDEVSSRSEGTRLGVNVTVEDIKSRAGMIAGLVLPDDAQIGVSLTDEGGVTYDGQNYSNVMYENSSPWETTTPIMLSGTEGTAIAYFPWKDYVTDLTAIPVDVLDQEDWMYSGEEAGLKDNNSNVSFEMKHAQTAVNIRLVRDESYTGAGVIEALSITSDGLASKGNYSAVDGTWDAASLQGVGEAIVIADNFQLTEDNAETTDVEEDKKENPYMLIPASSETVSFKISAMVDGNPYSAQVEMTEPFAQGKVYKLNVKIKSVGLTVDNVVILTDWDPETLNDGSFEPA